MSVLPNLIAFALGLGAAWFLKWETTDLVWSLWLSSLMIGYLTILSTIGAGVLIGIKVWRHGDFPKSKRMPTIIGGTLFSLFTLAFFSFHFCAFHAGHAMFLSSFFPVEGMPQHVFENSFMNPLLLWKTALTYLFPLYGFFLVATIIVERKHFFAPFQELAKPLESEPGLETVKNALGVGKPKKKAADHQMARPYVNVIRMHLLIFFFAGAYALNIHSFFVYAIVYAVYFFPWSAFFQKNEDQTAGTSVPVGTRTDESSVPT